MNKSRDNAVLTMSTKTNLKLVSFKIKTGLPVHSQMFHLHQFPTNYVDNSYIIINTQFKENKHILTEYFD